jgi:hypothetical protein
MPSSSHSFAFAIAFATGLLNPARCSADVAPTMPENIVVSGMGDHADLVFVFFADGNIEKGFLLDPKAAGDSGGVRLPREGLPEGKLSLLGVPRTLAEKSKNAPDPAWLTAGSPGVVRVKGVIHHYRIEKALATQWYQLDKTDDGLTVTLMNPDVLTSYGAENLHPESELGTRFLWFGIAGGAVVLLLAGVLVWGIKRRDLSDGSST